MPESGLSVEQMIARCAAGDHDALRQLYDAEAPRMLGVAMRLLKRRALAEDVVHDTFLRIWKAAVGFDGRTGQGRSWIYTILRNRALNILRGETRVDLVEDFEPFGLEAPDASPEEVISRLSDASALKRCLQVLDEMRQHIIVLAYTEGLSHGDIAARLGLPLGTIKSWLRRSLQSLKECLG